MISSERVRLDPPSLAPRPRAAHRAPKCPSVCVLSSRRLAAPRPRGSDARPGPPTTPPHRSPPITTAAPRPSRRGCQGGEPEGSGGVPRGREDERARPRRARGRLGQEVVSSASDRRTRWRRRQKTSSRHLAAPAYGNPIQGLSESLNWNDETRGLDVVSATGITCWHAARSESSALNAAGPGGLPVLVQQGRASNAHRPPPRLMRRRPGDSVTRTAGAQGPRRRYGRGAAAARRRGFGPRLSRSKSGSHAGPPGPGTGITAAMPVTHHDRSRSPAAAGRSRAAEAWCARPQ